jgi:hypothetical protein
LTESCEVVELGPDLEAGYSAFVAGHPLSTIYHTLEFRAFLALAVPGVPRYFVARCEERIVGVLPTFVASHERWGDVINSLPWYGSHGGCLVEPGCGIARSALLRRLAECLDAPTVAFSTVILTPVENAHLPEYLAALSPDATDVRTGQITHLPSQDGGLERQLEAILRHKTRNLVRKALKQGFTLEITDDDTAWQFLHATHVENMRAIGGRAKPWSHFDAMRQAIPAAWRQLLVTRFEGRPVAALLLLKFNRTVEYVTPVIKQEFRPLQPLSYAIWHGMLDAAASGYHHWNWGGTWLTQATLHHFKQGWGAVDEPYTYLVRSVPRVLEEFGRDRHAFFDAYPFYFLYPVATAGA